MEELKEEVKETSKQADFTSHESQGPSEVHTSTNLMSFVSPNQHGLNQNSSLKINESSNSQTKPRTVTKKAPWNIQIKPNKNDKKYH
jgi:hypothetical protein